MAQLDALERSHHHALAHVAECRLDLVTIRNFESYRPLLVLKASVTYCQLSHTASQLRALCTFVIEG